LWKQEETDETENLDVNIDEPNTQANVVNVYNENQATVDNCVEVMADTGFNVIGESDQAIIMTGDATALANVINLVNTNIVGSKLFFVILNIDGSLLGDLVLPAPELFSATDKNNTGEPVVFNINNQNIAKIDNQVGAVATTGNNQSNSVSDASIETGDAIAISNSTSLVNLSIEKINYYNLTINNLGLSSGLIYNWLVPGSVDRMWSGTTNFTTQGLNNQSIGGANPTWNVDNYNWADIKNTVSAQANTGGNQIKDAKTANIKTGMATAVSNLTNLVNLSLSGNNWFYGLINIIGDWAGNTIFAYPDLVVGLKSIEDVVEEGETIIYNLSFANNGYDNSFATELELFLPEGTRYLSDNSGFGHKLSGRNISWLIGELTAGQQGNFQIEIETGIEPELTWWQKLVPKAIAAQSEIEVSARAVAKTSQLESDTGNNSAVAKTKIIIWDDDEIEYQYEHEEEYEYQEEVEPNEFNDGVDQRQPILEIESENNVADFVYPGDIVTFKIEVKNKADVPALDAYLIHEIFDEVGNLYRSNELDIGQIGAYKSGNIYFGVPLTPDETPEGIYTSQTTIYAYAINDNEIESNQVTTEFKVKNKGSSKETLPKTTGDLLGITDSVCQDCDDKFDLWPYILLFTQSALWTYYQSNKWVKEAKNKRKPKAMPKRAVEILFFILILASLIWSASFLLPPLFRLQPRL